MALLDHTLLTGQSLSLGSQGVPGLSTVSEAVNAHTVNKTTGALQAHQISSASNQRPDLSMGYRIAQHTPATEFAFTTEGYSNSTIAALSKGGSTGTYEAMMAVVQEAYDAQIAASGTYRVRAIHFVQGEADQSLGTSVAAYTASAIAMRDDYFADIAAISGQAWRPPFVMSQMATWPAGSNPIRVALAQLALQRLGDGFYVAGGQYQLPYNDALHLTNVGYYRLGELHARAHNAVLDSVDWKALSPRETEITSTSVIVRFNVPVEPLVFDTTSVAAQTNYGFSLTDTAAVITGVAITAPDEVTLTTDQEVVEAGAKVGYAAIEGTDTSRGLGNLRDSETALSAYDNSPLPNWSVQFEDDLGIESAAQTKRFRIEAAYYLDDRGALHQTDLLT